MRDSPSEAVFVSWKGCQMHVLLSALFGDVSAHVLDGGVKAHSSDESISASAWEPIFSLQG